MPLIQTQSLLFAPSRKHGRVRYGSRCSANSGHAYQSWYLQNGDASGSTIALRARCVHPCRKTVANLRGAGRGWPAAAISRPVPVAVLSAALSSAVRSSGTAGEHPILVRNYDYPPQLCEGLISRRPGTDAR